MNPNPMPFNQYVQESFRNDYELNGRIISDIENEYRSFEDISLGNIETVEFDNATGKIRISGEWASGETQMGTFEMDAVFHPRGKSPGKFTDVSVKNIYTTE